MRIIFHIPERLSSEPSRASQIRPLKIIHEFEKMGYKVDLVVGTGHERKKCINRIKKNIFSLKGVSYKNHLIKIQHIMETVKLPILPN